MQMMSLQWVMEEKREKPDSAKFSLESSSR